MRTRHLVISAAAGSPSPALGAAVSATTVPAGDDTAAPSSAERYHAAGWRLPRPDRAAMELVAAGRAHASRIS